MGGASTKVVVTLLVLWPGWSYAQPLTLDDAIAHAAKHARGMIRIRAEKQKVQAQRDRARAGLMPTLNVLLLAQENFRNRPILEYRGLIDCGAPGSAFVDCDGTADFEQGPFLERAQLNAQSEPRFDLVLVARQLLFDGGRTWAALKQTEDRRARVDALHDSVLNNVRLDVVRAFYRYESARRTAEAFARRVALGEAQLARAKSTKDPGRASDAATAARNLADDRVTLARRQFVAARARRALNLAMARPASTPVQVVLPPAVASATATTTAALAVPSLERARAAALRHRPDLVATRLLVKEVTRRIDIAMAGYGPRVDLDAAYRRGSRRPDRVFGDPTTNFTASVGISVRWTLFEGLRTSASVREAKSGLTQIHADLDDLERRILSEVEDRRENLQLQLQVYSLASSALESARQAVSLARELFEQGNSTALELRDAELKHTNSELAVINARLQVEVAREELRRACGIELLP